jgi:hypothetical protein
MFKQFLIALGVLTIGVLAGWLIHPKCVEIKEIRTDTIVKIDTIRDTVLLPKIITQVKTVVDTLVLAGKSDTVYVAVNIPIEKKIYQTEEYRAEIEGYKPNLTFMEVYKKTNTITEYKTIETKVDNKFGVGLHVGYDYIPHLNKTYPTIGVGISYNFITF